MVFRQLNSRQNADTIPHRLFLLKKYNMGMMHCSIWKQVIKEYYLIRQYNIKKLILSSFSSIGPLTRQIKTTETNKKVIYLN